MSRQHRKILLFGGSGDLGEGIRLCARATTPATEVRVFPWTRVIRENLQSDPVGLAAHIEDVTTPWAEFDIVFANGITDPKAPWPDLKLSNILFPASVIQATQDRAGIRYLTLGTVFERFPDFAAGNPYVASKLRLCEEVEALSSLGNSGRIAHVRLHTVYGGKPKAHMFLGQIIQALEVGKEFRMSSGEQLREYHHVHDVAGALLALLARDWQAGPGPMELSSGAPVRLADLAAAVFSGCGRLDLLKVGAIPSVPSDNRRHVFPRSDPSLLPYYRDPIVGVVTYLGSLSAHPLVKEAG